MTSLPPAVDQAAFQAELDQLRVREKAHTREGDAIAALVVTEAEDHLRETEACGLAAGMTKHEAQLAAISAFGSVTAVVRAHASRLAGFTVTQGPGAYLSGAIVAAAAAAWYGGRARPAIRHLMRGWARYASAR